MTANLVDITTDHGVAILAFNRPPVNAIDLGLVRALETAYSSAVQQSGVNAIVLTGKSGIFSAGLDLKAVPAYTPEQLRELVGRINSLILSFYSCPLPMVAAIGGHAIAGGFVVALAADYRVGPEDPAAKFGLTEVRVGIPFPAGPMCLVAAELSPPVVRNLVLGGRNVGADRALSWGFLDELQPPASILSRAVEVARDFALSPRLAYERVKMQARAGTIQAIKDATAADPMLGDWLVK
ncbi:MAG: enoyl-CoA hydratase/isomerase family protein [Candidatus Schekmanbacteria bacterium]|nr:enoyl-CoA hydratase/isomerase family protein [Candidatus Schekmanbacteria bacterium]